MAEESASVNKTFNFHYFHPPIGVVKVKVSVGRFLRPGRAATIGRVRRPPRLPQYLPSTVVAFACLNARHHACSVDVGVRVLGLVGGFEDEHHRVFPNRAHRIRTMLEAERDSAMDLISHEAGLQAILREEGLRAAMQAAAR